MTRFAIQRIRYGEFESALLVADGERERKSSQVLAHFIATLKTLQHSHHFYRLARSSFNDQNQIALGVLLKKKAFWECFRLVFWSIGV